MRLAAFKLLLCSLLFASCQNTSREKNNQNNAFGDPTLREIYDAADQRNSNKLLPYAQNETAAYRMAFARVVASFTDSTLYGPVCKLLKDPIPYVRLYAAFAVGQYSDTTSLPILEKAIKKATIPEVKAEVLGAIGKSANKNAMDFLIYYEPSSDVDEEGKLWGIYYATLKGLLLEDQLRIVVAHLKSTHAETRNAAAHILSRQTAHKLDLYQNDLIEALDNENRGDIRAMIIRSLRSTETTSEAILSQYRSESDPRCKTELLRLMDPTDSATHHTIYDALWDGSPWVAMTAAEQFSSVAISDQWNELFGLARTTDIPEVKGAILQRFLMDEGHKSEGWALWKESSGMNDVARAGVIRFLWTCPSALDTLVALALDDSPIGTAAFETIAKGAEIRPDWKDEFLILGNRALQNGLLTQSYLTASNLRAKTFQDSKDISVETLESSLENFESEETIETRLEILRTIAFLKGREFKAPEPSVSHPIDWKLVQSIPDTASAKIYTSEGLLETALLIEDAPGSTSNFVSLVNSGFYNGLRFHRVVPHFVSQGGGPRGDGYGSTSYTIRSEFSPLHYGPGVMGLASAGKDTESCQFFFTHNSTPHLNGRYTIMGAITDGFHVLEQIRTGTSIDSIAIVPYI